MSCYMDYYSYDTFTTMVVDPSIENEGNTYFREYLLDIYLLLLNECVHTIPDSHQNNICLFSVIFTE